jgi:hypothetical protein
MKRSMMISVLAACICLILSAFVINTTQEPGFPEEIGTVLKTSCYGCHSSDASGPTAKVALNFDKWSEFNDSKKVSKLGDICELTEKGKMPPEKFIKSNPDKALTEDQKKLLCDWSAREIAKLLEGN